MARTKLFHTVVVVGSGLLASCGKPAPAVQEPHATPPAGSAAPADAAPAPAPDAARTAIKQDVPPPPPPPRIHALTPEKEGLVPPPPPPRVHAVKPVAPPKAPSGGEQP